MSGERDPRVDPRPGDVVKPDAPWGYERKVIRVTSSSVVFFVLGARFVRRLSTWRSETMKFAVVAVAR